MNEGKYGVAYLDKDSEGFSDKEPFIVDFESLHNCKECVETLVNDGYLKVIPFKYGKHMDYYNWDYVDKHRLVL